MLIKSFSPVRRLRNVSLLVSLKALRSRELFIQFEKCMLIFFSRRFIVFGGGGVFFSVAVSFRAESFTPLVISTRVCFMRQCLWWNFSFLSQAAVTIPGPDLEGFSILCTLLNLMALRHLTRLCDFDAKMYAHESGKKSFYCLRTLAGGRGKTYQAAILIVNSSIKLSGAVRYFTLQATLRVDYVCWVINRQRAVYFTTW